MLTEYAGALGVMAGGTRRYDGPMGKSDRALALGIIAALLALGLSLEMIGPFLFPALAALCALTIFNRIRAGMNEADA